MNNNRRTGKLIAILLLVAMISLVLLSGTYAKYTSTYSGSDTAVVASWKITNGNQVANIDLFGVSKIYDTKDVTDFTTGTVDADVRTGTDNGIIAPGTWGKFSYTVTNDSDVNAEYTVTYTVDEAGVPLKWSVDGNTWTDDLSNVSTTALAMDDSMTVTVYWKWDFTDTDPRDANDTALGEAVTLARPTVGISTIFTQVD